MANVHAFFRYLRNIGNRVHAIRSDQFAHPCSYLHHAWRRRGKPTARGRKDGWGCQTGGGTAAW